MYPFGIIPFFGGSIQTKKEKLDPQPTLDHLQTAVIEDKK